MTHPIIENLRALDALLIKDGFHAMPAYWMRELERFYDSGKMQSVWRVGRRGGKSSTICRVAVLEAYYGDHSWPAGDEGVVMIVSADRDQARARIRTCANILRALGRKFEQTADELRFKSKKGLDVLIRVHTASVAGVVGFTAIAVILDEVARWTSHDRGGSPAKEILSSVRPTMKTQPNAKLFMLSSPMGEEDVHALAFAQGDTALQTVHFAPTWVANPTLTEESCRKDSESEREFKREYAAIPQGPFETGFYDTNQLALCSNAERDAMPQLPTGDGPFVVACDPGFMHDAFAIAIAHAEIDAIAMKPVVVLDYYTELRGERGGYLSPEAAISFVSGLRKTWPGGFAVLGDQASAAVLVEAFARHGIMYVVEPWSPTTLMEKHGIVRTLSADSALRLPRYGALQKQLAKLGVKITASAQETITSADGHIGDAASACVAAIAEAFRMMPWVTERLAQQFSTMGKRLEGLNTTGSANEGDDRFTKSERCAICNELRGKCPHTS